MRLVFRRHGYHWTARYTGQDEHGYTAELDSHQLSLWKDCGEEPNTTIVIRPAEVVPKALTMGQLNMPFSG